MSVTRLEDTNTFAIDFKDGCIKGDTILAIHGKISIDPIERVHTNSNTVATYFVINYRTEVTNRCFPLFWRTTTDHGRYTLKGVQALIDTDTNSVMTYDYANATPKLFNSRDEAMYYINDLIDEMVFEKNIKEIN
jgi:hypothetical protein